MNSFNNPYVHGNWTRMKMRKNSLGDNKHTPGADSSSITNTPSLDKQTETVQENNSGMATPNAGPKSI